MRLLAGLVFAATCLSQTGAVRIPPLKTELTLEGQPVTISVWGTLSPSRLSATVDLGDFVEHLTPILAAQLNRHERCGERLAVEKVALTPAGLLTANVRYERYGCAKALGREINKRLVGGNAVVEVTLTPSVAENHLVLDAEVRRVDADGSLGEALRSGSFGDSLRQKIAASIESSVRKAADLKSALPEGVEKVVTLESARFQDGGDGRLWLALEGEVHLSSAQLQGLEKQIISHR